MQRCTAKSELPNMTHLPAEVLYTLVFDGAQLDDASRQHLAECPTCRDEMTRLQVLGGDLEAARRSQPTVQQIGQYGALAAALPQAQPHRPAWLEAIVAVLTWDGRQQPAALGVRSGAAPAYRQLFAADQAEIELMFERFQEVSRIEGDILPGRADESLAPALVELLDGDGVAVASTTARADGRFRLSDLPAGVFRLLITPASGPPILVDCLELE